MSLVATPAAPAPGGDAVTIGRTAGMMRRSCLIAKLHVLQRDDTMAAALRLRKTETDRRPVAVRRLDHLLLEPLDLLHLALRLRGLGVLGAEAVHEQLHPVNLALLRFCRGDHRHLGGRALFEIRVVIARVAQQARRRNSVMCVQRRLRNSRSCEMSRIAPG